NALVDVLSHCEDAFLDANSVEKGIMTLIDTDRAVELYGAMGPAKEISGGSAANTIAGAAMLGAKTAYVGKVRDDQLGQIFAHDIRAIGAEFDTFASADEALETGRCMVLVTPDGERSMSTYLGVSESLGPDDIDTAMMGSADWLYLEGYRFDGPTSVAAFDKAIAACKTGGGKVSITLSDPFCVDRHRDAFRALIANHTNLLFANEHEVMSLYQTDEFDEALGKVAKDVEIAAITVGAKGAYVVTKSETIHVPTAATKVVDATGAGDLFASGFLAGLVKGKDLATSASMGCVSAGEIIGHIGARPEADLKALMVERGL
ncbi:MAG: adenosine kinase, partial [Pseudomonadota bacterium]